jgi:hypothetical protein
MLSFLALTIVVLVPFSVALAGGRTVRVLSCLGHPLVKPPSYVITCADANVQWKHVRWSTWTATRATGHGDLYENDCKPYCAAGHFHTYHSTLTLSGVMRSTKYGRLFSMATFRYTAAGKQKTVIWLLDTRH